jgi:hypothetical protein
MACGEAGAKDLFLDIHLYNSRKKQKKTVDTTLMRGLSMGYSHVLSGHPLCTRLEEYPQRVYPIYFTVVYRSTST